jgi:hypothetical protein
MTGNMTKQDITVTLHHHIRGEQVSRRRYHYRQRLAVGQSAGFRPRPLDLYACGMNEGRAVPGS